MAVEPLYCSSMDDLKSKLRLSTATDTDTLAALNQIVVEVRLGFFSALTKTRALAIASLTLVDNPTTDNEILRARGATTEVVWCLYLLARRLPYSVINANSKINDDWNDEQARRAGELPESYLNSLKKQKDEGIAFMQDPVSTNPYSDKSSLITNSETPGIFDNGWGGLSHGEYPTLDDPEEAVDPAARAKLDDLKDAIDGITDLPDVYKDEAVKDKINELMEAIRNSLD